jgi:hypothetical protein
MSTKYSMETTATYEFKEPSRRTSSSRHSHSHDDDGNGSLTYSSAENSVNSAAGESTDSSFADIMKVLDGPDSTRDIAHYLEQKQGRARARQDERSVQESLAYSTDDQESHMMRSLVSAGDSTALHGADLISTITG